MKTIQDFAAIFIQLLLTLKDFKSETNLTQTTSKYKSTGAKTE